MVNVKYTGARCKGLMSVARLSLINTDEKLWT